MYYFLSKRFPLDRRTQPAPLSFNILNLDSSENRTFRSPWSLANFNLAFTFFQGLYAGRWPYKPALLSLCCTGCGKSFTNKNLLITFLCQDKTLQILYQKKELKIFYPVVEISGAICFVITFFYFLTKLLNSFCFQDFRILSGIKHNNKIY